MRYAPDWDYECVIAAVSPDGVLLSLNWRGSAKVTETVAKTTTLLSYEEISDFFRQQMNRCLYGEGAEMTVTAVKLGLFRIREQNSMETGLLVPAWVFTGRLTTSDGGQKEYNPLLVVNAIDGSIIDAGKGY